MAILEPGDGVDSDSGAQGKQTRPKPTKPLPTERVSLESQLLVLRASAAASTGAGRQAVSNADVAKVASISAQSVSICNPFWNDVGLLIREGIKQMPHEAVFDYQQAFEWSPEKAGSKLARVLETAWFSKAMLPRLSVRSMTRAEFLEQLADECRAPKEYKQQLELVIEYMRVAGLISVDGTSISRASREDPPPPPSPAPAPPPAAGVLHGPQEPNSTQPPPGMQRFSIFLPDKPAVTVEMPRNLDAADWILVADHLAGYIKRWKTYKPTEALKAATKDEDDQ